MLDIFFEALNYETVEQKKAYEVSELLGACVRVRVCACVRVRVCVSVCACRQPAAWGGVGRAGSSELTGDPVSTGDIGGQMGLFIGASLLTVLEILDYLCEVGGPGLQLWEAGRVKPQDPGVRYALATSSTASPRCSGTESWDTSGTESAPKGTPAPTW